jgi:hypothetical protein
MDIVLLKSLIELTTAYNEIENLLKKNTNELFLLQWKDIQKPRHVTLNADLIDQWRKEKLKLSKVFLKIIKKQIDINKKELGIKS